MKTILNILCLTFLFSNPNLLAQSLERESLRGFPGVCVVVDRISDDFAREVIDGKQLYDNMALRLHRDGIAVYGTIPFGGAYINLDVTTLKNASGDLWAIHVTLRFRQAVRLEGTGELVYRAATWANESIYMIGVDATSEVWPAINDQLSVFIDDFLAVNPPGPLARTGLGSSFS